MGQVFKRRAILSIVLAVGAFGCTTPPQQPVAPPVIAAPALSPEPAKSVMFDSDPNGEWNIFPDPTTGDVGVYHKGQYLGAVDGDEHDDPPEPHPSSKHHPDADDDSR